jgi:hypothetical protein
MFPQFEKPARRIDKKQWQEGFELILVGLFQKVAVADALTPLTRSAFVDTTRGALPERNWLLLILAAVAGLVQFVLDFAGYSNMARGSSKLLGIELPYNFREPLTRSRNLQDYWRRHNMTLFAWFRDYLFRPLRPHATGTTRASLLVVLVFVLSGLWHNATFGWVLWGLFMGCAVVIDIQVGRSRDRRRRARDRRARARDRRARARDLAASPPNLDASAAGAAAGGRVATAVDTRPRSPRDRSFGARVRASAYVIAVLAFSIVLVEEPTVSSALGYYREILTFQWVPIDANNVLLVVYVVLALVLSDMREHRMELAEGRPDPPTIPRAVLWAVMLGAIIVFSGAAAQPFVYFQF